MTKVTTMELHKRTFNIEKRAGEWQTNYRDAKATTGSTKAEAIGNLKAMEKTKIVKACKHMDKVIKRAQYFKENTEKFTTIFGFTPPRDFLMYALGCGLSLDVIALDKKLHTPDGISTNDYICQTYGDDACDMVNNMI